MLQFGIPSRLSFSCFHREATVRHFISHTCPQELRELTQRGMAELNKPKGGFQNKAWAPCIVRGIILQDRTTECHH